MRLDKNGSGFINFRDIKQLIRKCAGTDVLSNSVSDALQNALDPHQTGSVSRDRFTKVAYEIALKRRSVLKPYFQADRIGNASQGNFVLPPDSSKVVISPNSILFRIWNFYIVYLLSLWYFFEVSCSFWKV